MSAWALIYEGYRPEQEGLREALCTLGNGYFATRGAASESRDDGVHYPGTYLAGGYNRLKTEISGRVVENEDLVNFPNWLPLSFRFDDTEEAWFDLSKVELLDYRQELDLKHATLSRTIRFRDPEGRETTLTQRRIVHMQYPHLAAVETVIEPENWSGRLEFRSALDGTVINNGVARYRKLSGVHLKPLETARLEPDIIFLEVQTTQSAISVAQAARTQLFRNGEREPVQRSVREEAGYIEERFATEVQQGQAVAVEKVVTLYSSRDNAISECGIEARMAVRRAGPFAHLLRSHVVAWNALWRRVALDIEEPRSAQGNHTQLILRLHKFHLLQTVSPNTIECDASVPARGLHGEAYRGHIFWDELFIFPLLTLRLPEITRALLKYRYRRLDTARIAAEEAGYRGAMFPWQSGSDGREESQQLHLNPKSGRWIPDSSHLQRHISAAIAYNVWQYYQATDDREFLSFHGAELLLEIARFWSSIATFNKELDRYEILGVMGPDEYHDGYPGADEPGLNNNTYTNVMAVWVLRCALETLEMLPHDLREELCEQLVLTTAEQERWDEISRKMRVVFHGDGIISQFEGYDELEEFDWQGYRKKYGDIQRLDRILEAEGDTPNRYKLSKQADVLMLFYLFSAEELHRLFERLGYPFEKDTIPKTIDYYAKRTSHGSSLSRVVHSWVLARSDRTTSWLLFKDALASDVTDIQGGTTPEGIHLGAMAGTVDLVQRGFTGIQTRGDTLWFDPDLPEGLTSLHFHLRYRGHELEVTLTHELLTVAAHQSSAGAIKVRCGSMVQIVEPAVTRRFRLNVE